MSMVLFLGAFLLVMGGIHAFLYRGLVVGLGITSPGALWALRALAVLLVVSYPLARWLDGFAPALVVRAAHMVADTWFGLMFQLFWIGLVVWLVGRLLRLVGYGPVPGGWGVALVAVLAVGLCVVAYFGARADARVREIEVPVKGFSEPLGALRIAVFADLHAGSLVDETEVTKRVEEVRRLGADLVLIPGDLVDEPPARLAWLVPALARLRAPLGVFACTGNHEYYAGVEASVALLERAGIRMLMNAAVDLPHGLRIAGIEDRAARLFGRTVPPPADVLGPEAATCPTIFLNHTPLASVTEAAVAAGADLVLSGHTHGGQIWPFSLLTDLVYRYDRGLFHVGDGLHYTTCGLGWWGPPMRLGTVPEILLVRLAPKGG